jgi:hypothetical protein
VKEIVAIGKSEKAVVLVGHPRSWLVVLNPALDEVGNTDTSRNGMGNLE